MCLDQSYTLNISSSDSLLSLTQRLLRILKAVRTPLWRIFPSVYFLRTALWQFGLQSDETVTSQGSRSLATISCSSISFFTLCQLHTERTNSWFSRGQHFPNLPGLNRKSLHRPILMARYQSTLQMILYSLYPSVPFLFLLSHTTIKFSI